MYMYRIVIQYIKWLAITILQSTKKNTAIFHFAIKNLLGKILGGFSKGGGAFPVKTY